jgi:hypothetical protein
MMGLTKKSVGLPQPKRITLAPNVKDVVRNLVMRKDGTVLAGYRIGETRYDYTGSSAKASNITHIADVYANLTGREFHERVATRPYPVQMWARNLDARTPNPTPDIHTCDLSMSRGDLLNGNCGCETWGKHLLRMQHQISSTGMDDKITCRYFSLKPRLSPRADLHKQVQEFIATGKASKALRAVLEDEKRVNDTVNGWAGSRRMSEYEQGWLRVRSLSPGVQPHGLINKNLNGWDEMSLPSLSADIHWDETPFGRSVKVTAFVAGKEIQTAARVLTLARCTDLHYPENGLPPWQVLSETAVDPNGRPFTVEWSITGEILGADELSDTVEFELRRAKFVKHDYEEHDEQAPAAVDAAIEIATQTRDQVTTGQPHEAARFLGQVNVIITGHAREGMTAEQVVEERCESFIQMYAGAGIRMQFVGADVQSFALNATVPGEPRDTVGYQRRLRLPYLAAGMPTVTTSVGDHRGPYLGHTSGATRRAVMHDPQYATEGKSETTGREQNMHLAVGTLGSGKSVALGSIAYNGVRRGIRTIISDPSGPLAKLTRMPELADVSQEVNLLNGRRGILSPASLIPNPAKEDYPEPGAWAEALEQVRAERKDLVIDMALRCLPEELVEEKSEVRRRSRVLLSLAARQHGNWEITSTMWSLVDHLSAMEDPQAQEIAGSLTDASMAPLLRLLFPNRGEEPRLDHYEKTLTVITTPGISRAADNVPRGDWNAIEVGADVVLRLVGMFTNRLIYSKPRDERCVAIFDEAESLTDFGSGRSMLSRLGRDHSKWNIAVYLGVKHIGKEMLSGELKNFLASVLVGRMASAEPAVEALKLLGLTDERYVDILLGLSRRLPGEFVHADVDGRVGGLRVDVDYHPALKAALLTNPSPEGSSHWALTEETV